MIKLLERSNLIDIECQSKNITDYLEKTKTTETVKKMDGCRGLRREGVSRWDQHGIEGW